MKIWRLVVPVVFGAAVVVALLSVGRLQDPIRRAEGRRQEAVRTNERVPQVGSPVPSGFTILHCEAPISIPQESREVPGLAERLERLRHQPEPAPETPPSIAHDAKPASAPRSPHRRADVPDKAVEAVFAQRANTLLEKDGSYGYNTTAYGATFNPGSVEFAAAASSPDMQSPSVAYALTSVRVGSEIVARGGVVAPHVRAEEREVVYDRGAVEERYVPRADGLEQIFVLTALPEGRGEIVVTGRLSTPLQTPTGGTSANSLSFTQNGTEAINISQAVAIDATGQRLDLALGYEDENVVIRVPAHWVETATLPITIDPLIGSAVTVSTNADDPTTSPSQPAPLDVAYSVTSDAYLVVWTDRFGGSSFDWDIYAQRVSGSTGALLGGIITIDNSSAGSYECAVAWGSVSDRFAVVWHHDPSNNGSVSDQEIRLAIVSGSGSIVVSSTNLDPWANQDLHPDVAFDGTNFYMVRTHVNSTNDIWGARFTDAGTLIAFADPENSGADDQNPSLAWGGSNYLVVYQNGAEISGRTVSSSGTIGAVNTYTSGQSGNKINPDVAVNTTTGEWLVVWERVLSSSDHDIWGVRATAAGAVSGSQISIENDGVMQRFPYVRYCSTTNEWFVVWDDTVSGTRDIYGQRISATGGLTGAQELLASTSADEHNPALAYRTSGNELLAVWHSETSNIVSQRFGFDTTPPGTPTALAPTGCTNDTTPTLSWTSVTDTGGSGLASYSWELSTDSSFTTLTASGSTTSTSATLSATGEGTYYWRVRAVDNAGNTSPYSTALSFTIDTASPGETALIAPTDSAVTGDNTPTFDWSDVTDPCGVTYQLQVDNSGSTFPSPEVDATGITTSTYTPASALAAGTYSWRVRASDGAGNIGAWSTVFTVSIDTTAPAAPALSAPANTSCTTDTTPTFDWSDVSDPSGVTYTLQADNSGSAFGSPEINVSVSVSTYTPSTALTSGSYSWRVQAVDGAGNTSAWSTVWTVNIDTTSPGAPTLLTPASTSCTGDTTPTFDWSDVSDPCGVSYQLQVDNSGSTFPSPEVDAAGVTTSTYTVGSTLAAGTYSWRVRATDGGGAVGAWSSIFTIVIDTTPPTAAPTLLTPTSGSFTNDTTPTFDWSDVSDPCGVSYQLQVDNSGSSFPSPEISVAPTTSTFTPTAVLAEGTYSWRVRGVDGAGNVGTWSSVFTVTVDTTAPAAPTPTAPANGSCTSDTTPTFDWSDVTDGSGVTYELQADNSGSGFGSPEINVTASTSTYTPSTALATGTYSWRVRAVDGATNAGAWSAVWTVGIDTTAPVAPTLLTPATAVCTNDTTPTFDWSDVSDPCGVTYQIQVDVSPADFVGNAIDTSTIATSTFTPTTALPAGTYGWRVRATDGGGAVGAWSSAFTVTIDTTGPAAVTLATPASGSTTNDSTPTFDWSDATDPCGVSYQLQVDNSGSTFPSPEVATTVSPSTFTPTTALADGTYSWRARAVDGAGNAGTWSSVFTVSVDATAPAVPTLIAPTNGSATNDTTPTFDWSDVTDSSGITYELQVDNGGSTFPSPEVTASPTASTFTPTTALAEATYSWRVRATDGAGNSSAWSSVWTVTVDTTPPGIPAFVSGGGTGCLSDNTPTFDWTDVADPSGVTYQIQVDASPADWTGNAINASSLTASTYTPTGALADGTWNWRVRATDGAGNAGGWSTTFTVTVDTTAPVAVTLLTPANSSCTNDTTPIFDWSDATDSCGVTYEIQVDNSGATFPSPEASATGLTTSAFTVSTALATGTYSWRVRAVDGGTNASSWSPVWTVTVDTSAPAAPTLSAPASAFVSGDNTPTFDWSDVTDGCGVTYEIQVDNSGSSFPSPEISVSALTTSTHTLSAALADGTYSWRVRATDGAGNTGVWSTVWTVTVDTTPPPSPTALQQYYAGGVTPIPWGAATTSPSAVFEATVTDIPSTNTVRLHVEVKPVATSFNGVPNATSSFLSSGSTVQLAVSGLPEASYKWRVWSEDSIGQFSPFAEFSGSTGTDFSVDINNAPTAPTGPMQFMLNGTTTIAVGGTTTETGVVLKANVSDPEGNTVRARFEVKPVGVAFDGTGLVNGTWVSSGGLSQATILLSVGNHHWRVQTEDNGGLTSGWTAFGGNAEPSGVDVQRLSPGANAEPNLPTVLAQYMTDGVTAIGVGGTTTEAAIILRASVSDSDGNPCALSVEVKPTGVPFDGTSVSTGSYAPSGFSAQVTVPVTAGSYHWRAHASDTAGGTSSWVVFGGNTDPDDADFTAAPVANAPPAVPATPVQVRLDGVTPIAVGGDTNETSVILRATLTDPDAGNSVALEVEVKPVGTPFVNIPSASGSYVASGSLASVTVSGLTVGAAYHWQARAVDSFGATSSWVAFGENTDLPPPAGTDFSVSSVNTAPSATGAAQLRSNGTTTIAAGGTTNESTVVFQATVSDSDSSAVRLEVELVPNALAFTGSPTALSAYVTPGTTAQVTIAGSVVGTAYKWRFRATDTGSLSSAWVDFGASNPDFTITPNATPAAASDLSQRRLNGTGIIALGGQTGQVSFRAFATLSDPDPLDQVKLQVELKPAETEFDGTGLISGSLVANGSTTDITVPIPALGWYHWRARTVDQNGASGAWTAFASVTPDNHFERVVNQPPTITAVSQRMTDNTTTIPPGGTTTEPAVHIRATLTDPEAETVSFEVEVRPSSEPFSNVATHSADPVTSGTTATVVLALPEGQYHWQYRAIDESGMATPWTTATGGSSAVPGAVGIVDFALTFGGSRGGSSGKCNNGAAAASGSLAWVVLFAFAALAMNRRKL